MAETTKSGDTSNIWEQLRKPFDPKAVGMLPKGGIQLDYVGHAAVTDRLNTVVGPDAWELKPMAVDDYGRPVLDGNDLWCWLTIKGTTKMCVGDGRNNKERIGDALRNGAMRFGVALDLWSKDELESNIEHPGNKNVKPSQTPDQPDRVPEPPMNPETLVKIITSISNKSKTPEHPSGFTKDESYNVFNNLVWDKFRIGTKLLTERQAQELLAYVQEPKTQRATLEMLTEKSQ